MRLLLNEMYFLLLIYVVDCSVFGDVKDYWEK